MNADYSLSYLYSSGIGSELGQKINANHHQTRAWSTSIGILIKSRIFQVHDLLARGSIEFQLKGEFYKIIRHSSSLIYPNQTPQPQSQIMLCVSVITIEFCPMDIAGCLLPRVCQVRLSRILSTFHWPCLR